MVCIYCKSPTRVSNSRLQRRANYIWRCRICLKCGNIFTTEERPELSGILMVKRSGKLKSFNRDKLFLAVYESCRHRPGALSEASALTQTILNDLATKHQDGVVEAKTIIASASQTLGRFDKTAATFYAAYHPTG